MALVLALVGRGGSGRGEQRKSRLDIPPPPGGGGGSGVSLIVGRRASLPGLLEFFSMASDVAARRRMDQAILHGDQVAQWFQRAIDANVRQKGTGEQRDDVSGPYSCASPNIAFSDACTLCSPPQHPVSE